MKLLSGQFDVAEQILPQSSVLVSVLVSVLSGVTADHLNVSVVCVQMVTNIKTMRERTSSASTVTISQGQGPEEVPLTDSL